jgi:hypothetical protein
MAEVPEVRADLVGAAGEWAGFDQSGAVRVAAQDAEFGFRGEAGGVDVAGAGFGGLGGDWGVARKFLRRRMAMDAGEVDFFDLAALELRLHEFGEMPRAGENDEPAGVGVEPVGGPGF